MANKQNKDQSNIELQILEAIDNDFEGIIKTIQSFIQQDYESCGWNGKEEIAALLVGLGSEISIKILKKLTTEEIEILVLELANIRILIPEFKEKIFYEFYNSYIAQQYIIEGGISFAKNILEKALGESEACAIISRLTLSLKVRPFEFIRQFNSSELHRLLIDEDIKIIALVLSQLRSSQSANFFNKLSAEQQLEIIDYLGTIETLDLQTVKEIERNLEKKSVEISSDNFLILDGINTIVEILNYSNREIEKTILNQLESRNKQLHDNIVNQLFVFEDIICLTNTDIQKIINSKEISDDDLILSLKGVPKELKTIILNNIIGEKKVIIEYKLEQLGPVYTKDVIQAQHKIIEIIKKLQDSNEIIIPRCADEIII